MRHRLSRTLRLLALTLILLISPSTLGLAQAAYVYRPCEVAVAASNFSGRWAIYLLRPYESKVYELSQPGVADRRPVWSPDGREIAFERRVEGNWDIYVSDLFAGTTNRLTDHPAFDGHPSWSPDGKRIAFESSREGTLGIYSVSMAGGDPQRIFVDDVASTSPVWRSRPDSLLVSSWSQGQRGLFTVDKGNNVLTLVDQHEELGQIATGGNSFASASLIAGEAHILIGTRQGVRQDLSQPGRHHEWPAWDQTSRRWAALELVGGNHYEHPLGWRIVILGQEGRRLPLFLPGQWERLSCAPSPMASGTALALLRPIPERELRAVGMTIPAPSEEVLTTIPNLTARQPRFVESVAPSFVNLRADVLHESGYDALRALNDAWRDLATESGATFSWHKAGRAFDMQFNLSDRQARPLLFISKESLRGETYFRLYIRAARQDGSQGEPLRQSLWVIDFDQRDALGRSTGGRTYAPNEGYFVDFTDLAQRHGWVRISAATEPNFDWRRDFYAMEYWHYERKDGLCWYDALSRLYPPERLREWVSYDRLINNGHSRKMLQYFCVPKST